MKGLEEIELNISDKFLNEKETQKINKSLKTFKKSCQVTF